jgi:hypothetical protein
LGQQDRAKFLHLSPQHQSHSKTSEYSSGGRNFIKACESGAKGPQLQGGEAGAVLRLPFGEGSRPWQRATGKLCHRQVVPKPFVGRRIPGFVEASRSLRGIGSLSPKDRSWTFRERLFRMACQAAFSLSSKSMVQVEFPGCLRNIHIVTVEPGGMTMLSPSCIVN